MDCNQLKEPLKLNSFVKSKEATTIERIFLCFNKLYKIDFKRTGKFICKKYPRLKHNDDELVDISFNKGLHSFLTTIQEKGFQDKGVSVDNSFRAYFLMQLKGEIQRSKREIEKVELVDSVEKFEKSNRDTFSDLPNNLNKAMDQEMLLLEALNQLNAKQRTLIIARKLKRLKDDEIAILTGLQSTSIQNEVYKSMLALKKIVKLNTNGRNYLSAV